MPKNRKYLPHSSVLLVTARTEEGLPLPPSHVMNFIIWGILAKARSMYRVRVCHFLFMANHLHMILVVDDPEHISDFMRYVKAEISHAVNKLLGRRKKTIWAEGYDSPHILSAEKVIYYIKYIYLNPARASLVDKIDDYPGVSSWRMFRGDKQAVRHARVSRPELEPLPGPALGVNEQQRIVENWKLKEFEEHEFILEPWAWLDTFPGLDQKKIDARIMSEIRAGEQGYREERKALKKTVLGPTALRRQSMLKDYTPRKHSRRMIALSDNKEERTSFIEHFRALCAEAKAVYESWKKGDLRPKIPPGLFAPRMPALVSALSP